MEWALYRGEDQGFGQGFGSGAEPPAEGGGAVAIAFASFDPPEQRGRLLALLPDARIAVDLGERIGSAVWLRGAATLAAMIVAVIRVSPGIPTLPGLSPAAFAPAEQDEMRAIGIAPKAYGGDSGRPVVPGNLVRPLTSAPERAQIDLTATLGAGDGPTRMLERQGVTAADAHAAVALIAKVVPRADIAGGTRIAITLGRRPNAGVARPLDRLSFRARFDMALTIRRDDGRLVLDAQPIAVDETPLRLQGVVGASLYRSARSAGVPANLVADYLRAIGRHIDIDDIASDDRFDVILEHRRAATGEVRTGRLLYAGLQHGAARLQLLDWRQGDHDDWFDADGAGDRTDGFAMPVEGGRLTSSFGMRFHPILGFSRMHQGVDLAAPYGTPIVAASDGVVRFAGPHGGHGNFVQIVHAGGLGTGYAHMSSFVVSPGMRVRQGQLIGYVGMTGLTTGPHLHFEVYRNGVPIDPAGADFTTMKRLDGVELDLFRITLAKLTALAPGRPAETATGPKG